MAIAEELRIVVKAEVNKAVADLKKLQGQTKKNEKAAKGLGAQIGKMALQFGSAAAAIALVRKGFRFASEAAEMAAAVNQVGAALDSMAEKAGIDSTQMLKDLSAAAGDTIDMLSLMKQASRALVFNIPAQDLHKLMKIARASATATGESVEQMFNSIVTGVARGSRMLLDNLGIIVDVEKAQRDYAESLGKTVEQLTAKEKSQATLNAVLENGGDIMERVGKAGQELTDLEKWQQMNAAIKDIKAEIGQNFVSVFAEAAENTAAMLRNLRDSMQELRKVRKARAGEAELEELREALAIAEANVNRRRGGATKFQSERGVIADLRLQIENLEREQLALFQQAGAATGGPTDKPPIEVLTVTVRDKFIPAIDAARQAVALMNDEIYREGAGQGLDVGAILGGGTTDSFTEQSNKMAESLDMMAQRWVALGEAAGGSNEEIANTLDITSQIMDSFGALGEALVMGEGGFAHFAKSVIGSIASVLDALANQMFAVGAAKFALLTLGPGASFAAAAAIKVAAGMIRGMLTEFAEGGIVTGPTAALIGEAGPEAVIPLSKMGGMGDTIIIQGDLLTQDEAYARVTEYQQRRGRSW